MMPCRSESTWKPSHTETPIRKVTVRYRTETLGAGWGDLREGDRGHAGAHQAHRSFGSSSKMEQRMFQKSTVTLAPGKFTEGCDPDTCVHGCPRELFTSAREGKPPGSGCRGNSTDECGRRNGAG